MEIEEKSEKKSLHETLYRVPRIISQLVERFFYNLGFHIARRPKRWMICCSVLVILCLGGLFRFRQEKNPLKLWVPEDSDFVRDTEWLTTTFKEGQRIENMIFAADDVLEPEALVQLNEITKRIFNARTNGIPMISWVDVCFKVPIISGFARQERRKRQVDDNFFDKEPVMSNKIGYDPGVLLPTKLYCDILNSFPKGCLLFSIMDIWDFNSTLIKLQSKEEIVRRFNSVHISPTLGHPLNFSELLGGVKKDEKGRIVSAKVVKTQWVVYINFTEVNMDEIGNDAGTADWSTKEVYDWEAVYLKELEEISKDLSLQNTNDKIYSIYYEAGRSFGDISQDSIFHDVEKLIAGILLMSLYVQAILSKFNWVEWRFWLTSVALLCIGGAFAVAIGLCSLAGIPYGPVHTSLPFMLMGLGVDDTFVMMAAWEEVSHHEKNRHKPLHERVALALSHAGAAISVTSLTDVVAFVIGASTILPSLHSFCIYAAVGVFVTFILQVTFFVAFFTLDCERVEKKRNGVFPCIVHENYVPSTNSKDSISWRLIDLLYTNVFLTLPGKIGIIFITIVFATFGGIGSSGLEQWFDPVWFLPKDSYLSEYLIVKGEQFPKVGHEVTAFVSNVDFVQEFPKILNLSRTLENATFTESVKNWPMDFIYFLDANFNIDAENQTLTKDEFQKYLSNFLFSRIGGKYQRNFRFAGNLTCGEPAPTITIASIDFKFVKFSTPYEWIPGMDEAKRTVAEAGFEGFATVWSEMFAAWVTDKVISQEVVRNLILALICVMGMTALLIAEPQTCLWILLCVLLTLLDVCGFMYYWGLTIDIVSCIGLELAVGLSVDYAAHVAHGFLNTEGRPGSSVRVDRSIRALKAMRHIGAAVLFGAGSTLLALSLLSFSRAYVFRAFFKIFLLVIVFGLWHGLLLLPVVLSTIGPRSLRTNFKRNVKTRDKETTRELEAAVVPLNKE